MAQHDARIRRARAALHAFEQIRGADFPPIPEESLCDLLTDLRHYCAEQEVDFETAVSWSERHFAAEVQDEG
jgi:hypothetical protein